jgi:hypothetical protein
MADPNCIQVNGRYGQAEINENSNPEPGPRDFLLHSNESGDQVKLKKELGLMEGTAIILGIIMGSGK